MVFQLRCNLFKTLIQIQIIPVDRYYILSTAYPDKEEYMQIEAEIQRRKNVHGCQLYNANQGLKKFFVLLCDFVAIFSPQRLKDIKKHEENLRNQTFSPNSD